MGLDTPSGGNTSHGYYTPHGRKVSSASIFFESLPYKVNPQTGYIDYEKLEERALDFRPKILICGGSSYSREWDYGSYLVPELKTQIKKYFEGDEEALPSVLEAILWRKLAGKHEETDDELMDELEVQPRDDVDDEEFESDFDNLYSTDEEILAMFLMK
ncbi:hypothetical protein E1A91_D10G161600v1 [Gossypium mustelinum]|uniref:Serine hydroxymethyltransferase-like domain-containing protein n=2 Tax=Gossypium TaxID=3633 RepID=A0A5D2T993_GOSMU|nr:hypothetical protein ES332_D10G171100v1 [Gossypium tomentosum]TYI61275.1 hypothetical protein E1A91_D10G161600v1 [Gossypium mustelinum]